MADLKSKQEKMRALLNRKRKAEVECTQKPEEPTTSKVDDSEIVKDDEKVDKAKKAILFEAKRAKDRADSYGPQGYLRPKSLATNKRFLHNTLKSTLPRKKTNES